AAVAGLEARSRKDFKAFGGLLAPDATFQGRATTVSGAREIAATYERLGAMLVKNELKKIFVDGDEVCMIYEFVTDTSAGAVPTMEWIKVAQGRVRSIWLLTDHVRWPAALAELARRSRPPAP